MSNVLSESKQQQVIALGRLGWSLRRIQAETGVRRETAAKYLKSADVPIREARHRRPPKPASSGEAITGSERESKPASEVITGSRAQSACLAHHEFIELSLGRGRNAMAIWQDLVADHGFTARYASVSRYVRKLRESEKREAFVRFETDPGVEGQVDYGVGPLVRCPISGKYKRTRLFVFVLGHSRKAVRLLAWKSSSRIWCQLHEEALRRLGGAPRVIALDNLREGVIKPDVYDPELNPLYRDCLKHYGITALPCRVRDPNRKGKVESGVGHAQRTPLQGIRFESFDEAQAYLDRWEERCADTRIHGTTKRQVLAVFREEKPHLQPLPLEPFRYYEFGIRTVHLDGFVEVKSAYYGAPPGTIGKRLHVQWDEQ
ncbi:MAG: IS21 family transposase, partial [Myxococcota bacterium]